MGSIYSSPLRVNINLYFRCFETDRRPTSWETLFCNKWEGNCSYEDFRTKLTNVDKTASNTHTHPSWVTVALYLIGLFNRWWLAVASLLNRLVRKAQTRVCPPSELQHKCFNLKKSQLESGICLLIQRKNDTYFRTLLLLRNCSHANVSGHISDTIFHN